MSWATRRWGLKVYYNLSEGLLQRLQALRIGRAPLLPKTGVEQPRNEDRHQHEKEAGLPKETLSGLTEQLGPELTAERLTEVFRAGEGFIDNIFNLEYDTSFIISKSAVTAF